VSSSSSSVPPTVVITGAGQGIGAALARRFAADGVELVLADINLAAVAAVADEVGGTAHELDVSDPAAVVRFATELERCDVLVNNAAITTYEPLLETTPEAAARVLGVNLLGPLFLTQALAPQLQASGRGVVINFSSITAHYHPSSTGLYSTSKAAVEALTRALAVELGPLGIRVDAVAPGSILTPGSGDHYGHDPAALTARTYMLPIARAGEVDDITEAVVFLASAKASYITGQTLIIDGGHTVAGGEYHRLARKVTR